MQNIFRFVVAAALAHGMLGCGGESAAGTEEPPKLQESELVATWTMDVNGPSGPLKVILDVDADHAMIASVRKKVAVPGADSVEVDVQRESMTWSLAANGSFTTTKVSCQYTNASTGQLEDKPCSAPVSETYPVSVSGKNLTTIKGTLTFVFVRQ